MKTSNKTSRKQENRREQILLAAIESIQEHGFEKTTMDEIAERAELSKGTLYFYFKDKSALFRAIRRESIRTLSEEFMKIIQQDEPGAVLVKKMAESFLAFMEEKKVLSKALAQHSSQVEPTDVEDIEEVESELRVVLTRALQIGIQDGSIPSTIEPKILAIQIGFIMRGILQFHLSNTQSHINKVMDEHNLTIHSMLKLFIDALLNQIDTDRKTEQK